MNRFILGSCIALLVLMPVLAAAQARPSGGGTSVGTATPRGGDAGTSSSGSSGSSAGGGSAMSSRGGMGSAPSGTVAVGRYDGPRSGESVGTARLRSGSPAAGQAVPGSERPRGDTPTIGQAVRRSSAPNHDTGGVIIGYPDYGYGGFYSPYYYGYYYGSYWPGYGYYGSIYGYPWYYDPYSWWSGLGPLYGWGMYALPMSAYSSLWSDYYAAVSPSYIEPVTGSIKLKVKPKDAEVYVDGTFYGAVDHYDGAFQHLDLKAGTHQVEIRANGYETIQLQVRVLPGKTITYNGQMKQLKK